MRTWNNSTYDKRRAFQESQHMIRYRLAIGLMAVTLLVLGVPTDAARRSASTSGLRQFTTQGHVVGFTPHGFYLTNAEYLLNVEFINARQIKPGDTASHAAGSEAAPLSEVAYPNLWEGITLIYEATSDGLVRSTYRLNPQADVSQIRLRYNVPIGLQPDGALSLAYESGRLNESAPLAWQEINGQQIDVSVHFNLLTTQEVGFVLGDYNPVYPVWIDPILTWHTFLGGSDFDMGQAITLDGSGNIYVMGRSGETWGSPVRGYGGGYSDAFVAKLDATGTLLWHTFLGGSGTDSGEGIAVDSAGNVYAVGYSDATWGSNPRRSYSGLHDAFVVRLNANGQLQWHTFLGGGSDDWGFGVATDGSGNVLVLGNSYGAWGTSPIRSYVGSDAFVVKLNSSGGLTWLTFLGSSLGDGGTSLAVNTSGNVWVAGYSEGTWETPLLPHSGTRDVFVARLNANGALLWNTFLGGSGSDEVGHEAVVVDGSGNLYVVGNSTANWGTPLRNYGGGSSDGFALKLNASGGLLWHTFLGGSGSDQGRTLTIDTNGNAYASGNSTASWGTPVQAYAGGSADVFVTELSADGALLWNTFLGGSDYDSAYGSALNQTGSIYVAGYSATGWGSPIVPFSGSTDAFVAKLSPQRVFNLNTGQGYTAIQPAVTAAGAGDVISTTPGVYSETVVVDRNLVLTQPPSAGATISGNLVINSNMMLLLSGTWSVEGAVTNNGALQQIQTVPAGPTMTRFLFLQNAAGTAIPYHGVDITPNSIGLGATTVTIRGNQATCNVGDQLIQRCFDIAATNPQSATVRFWYLNSERGTENPNQMNAYHWNTATQSWDLLPAAAIPRGTVGSDEWTEAVNVSSYSPFGLADGLPAAPTAVTTLRLFAVPSSTAQAASSIGLVALGVIGIGVAVKLNRLRRKSRSD